MTPALVTGYLLLTVAAGAGAVGLVPVDWRWPERVALSLVVGLTLGTLVAYLIALAVGDTWASAVGGPAVVLAIAIGLARPLHSPIREPWLRAGRALRELGAGRLPAGAEPGTLLGLLLVGAALYVVVSRALMPGPGGTLSSGYGPTWADWSVHASYAQSFVRGHNLPPTDTLLNGSPLRYPFMADFQSSLLLALGLPIASALVLPSWLVIWAAVTLLWSLARRLLGGRLGASVALALMLFGGSAGFLRLYPDTCHTLTPAVSGSTATLAQGSCHGAALAAPTTVLAVAVGLPRTLTHLPRFYDGESGTPAPFPNLQWWEPLLVYWLPQRDFDYGVALLATVALAALVAIRERRSGPAWAGGLLGGAIPLFNPFGWIAAVVLVAGWVTLYRQRALLGLLVPLVVLGLPRELFDALGPHGQIDNPVGANAFPFLQLGWLATTGAVCTVQQLGTQACAGLYLHGAGPGAIVRYVARTLGGGDFWSGLVGFWLLNTGLFLPLAAVAAGLARWGRGRLGRALVPGAGAVRFCLPAFLLFAIANIVVLQPWSWDNTKLLAPWYLVAAIPVAGLLAAALRQRWLRVPAALVLLSLVASGALAMARALPGQGAPAGGTAPSTSIGWAGPAELAVARVVRRRTSPSAVFLTEGQPNDPVTTLAGRRVVLAYDGWLWSYGIPLRAIYRQVARMLAGCPTGIRRCAATRLMAQHHVDYVAIEPGNYNNVAVNAAWFRAMHFPVLVATGGYVIYRVEGRL